MKRSTVFHAPFALTVCALLILLATGCPLPVLTGGPAASSSTGSITGKVQAQSSADAAGVTVTAEPTDGIRAVSIQKAISSRQMSKAVGAARATTGSDGSYTYSGLPPGTYTLNAVSRDGLSKAMCTSVSVGAGSTTQAVVMALMRTGQIRGNVTLADGSDPTGIVVFIAGTSCSAMTAADGSYLMSWVPAGSGYTLVMSKTGWSSEIRSVNVSVNATTMVPAVTLNPYIPPQTTGSVFGTATLGASSVHAGIFVYLAGTSYICVTGADGRFDLAGVAPGSYTIMASKEGYASQSATVVVPVGPVGPVSFTLQPLGPFYVTYDANGASGGSVPVDPTTYMQGYRVVVLGNTGNLARPGYSFAGWNTQADGNGITYTKDQAFFIANSSVVLYAAWSVVVTPPNVAGYWDMTLYLQDMDPMSTGWLFIRQNGWEVTIRGTGSGMAWAGTLEGQAFTITTKVPDTGAIATFAGTVSDTGISGPVSAPGFPPGTFVMTRVTSASHLDLQGSCAGTPVTLNTEYARTNAPMVTYSFGFSLSPAISASLGFDGDSLAPGTYLVNEQGGSGTIRASISTYPGSGTPASAGSVTITRYDGATIAGSYDNLSFPDGSSLSGGFDLTLNVNDGGTFTVQGTWMGTPVSATAPVPTSWPHGGMSTGLYVTFFDDQLEASLWLGVPGTLVPGDNQLNLGLRWDPASGSQINGGNDQPGNLHITTLTAHNLAGSYTASFREGGSISGYMDLKF